MQKFVMATQVSMCEVLCNMCHRHEPAVLYPSTRTFFGFVGYQLRECGCTYDLSRVTACWPETDLRDHDRQVIWIFLKKLET